MNQPTTLLSMSDHARARRAYIAAIMRNYCLRCVGVDEDRSTIRFACNSFTEPDKEYEMTHNIYNDSISCNCPDFVMRKEREAPTKDRGPTCKHLFALLQVLKGAE